MVAREWKTITLKEFRRLQQLEGGHDGNEVTIGGATIGSSRRKFRDGPVSFKNGNENWFETCGSGNPGLLEPRNDHGNAGSAINLWWLILLIGSGCFPLCNCIHISEPPRTILHVSAYPECVCVNSAAFRGLALRHVPHFCVR